MLRRDLRATGDAVDFGHGPLLHVRVRYAGKSRLEFSKKLPVVGRKTVTFKASYANGVLRFGKTAINGLGRFGDEVQSFLDRYLGVRTSLRDIPFDIKVRSLAVNASGLQIGLAGRNVSYSD